MGAQQVRIDASDHIVMLAGNVLGGYFFIQYFDNDSWPLLRKVAKVLDEGVPAAIASSMNKQDLPCTARR